MKDSQLDLVQTWAATAEDLQKEILRHQPEIVHFSGHGVGSGGGHGYRDFVSPGEREQGGLIFENALGHIHFVPGDALGRLFGLFVEHVKCVVINACNSHELARVIADHVDYVIGMTQPVSDPAAIHFSRGFYNALQAGKDFPSAWEHGRSAIELAGCPGQQIPILVQKP